MFRYSLERWLYPLAMIATAVVLSGCATPVVDSYTPAPRPLGIEYAASENARQQSRTAYGDFEQVPERTPRENIPEPQQDLTLREVLKLVLMYSPALKGASAEVRAREAESVQAGKIPNPEMGLAIDNFSGSGPYSGQQSAETTVQLSQLIELGGDRAARTKVAVAEGRLAGWDYEAERLNVLTKATNRFIGVMAAQKRVELADQLLRVAQELEAVAAKRVVAGKSSEIDRSSAEILVAQTQAQYARTKAELAAARRRLALLWGSGNATFHEVVGSFPTARNIPPPAALEGYLRDNPLVARYVDELEARRAKLAEARAKAIPDITVGIGARQFRESNDNALVATVSVPLAVFDRNQGAVAAAGLRIDETDYSKRQAENDLHGAFQSAYSRLAASAGQLKSLESEVLPKAQAIFDAISAGYREGKFDILRLLDAQRSLFESRMSAVEAQMEYLTAKAELEGLIGRSLESVPPVQKEQEKRK